MDLHYHRSHQQVKRVYCLILNSNTQFKFSPYYLKQNYADRETEILIFQIFSIQQVVNIQDHCSSMSTVLMLQL